MGRGGVVCWPGCVVVRLWLGELSRARQPVELSAYQNI